MAITIEHLRSLVTEPRFAASTGEALGHGVAYWTELARLALPVPA